MADTVEGVEVKLGADTSAAQSGMASASASIAASLQSISAALSAFGGTNKATVTQAVQNNANLSRSFLELKGSATGGFNAITGVIERFRGVLGTLAAALAGGALFKGSVDSMLRLEEAVRGLEINFGLSAEAATHQAVALKLAGVSAESYEMMAQRVEMRLRTQSSEFDRLGISYKDAAGNLLPMDQILQNVYKRMQDFKAGTDQQLLVMTAIGRNAKGFATDMMMLNAVQTRATEIQKQLNIEMGPAEQEAIRGYRIEMNAFSLALETIGEKIGVAVMPRLEGLAQWFNAYGPAAIKVIMAAIDGLLTAFTLIGTQVGNVVIYVVGKFQNIVTSAVATWQAVKAAASFNFGAIPGIVAHAEAMIEANDKAITQSMVDNWADAKAKIAAIWSNATPTTPGPKLPGQGPQHFQPKPTGGDDQMAQLENQLKAQEDAYNKQKFLQGSFETWSETQTRDYWANVLATAKLSAKERLEVENKYLDADRKLMTDAYSAHVAGLKKELEANKENQAEQERIMAEIVADTRLHYGEQSAQVQEALAAQIKMRQEWADKEKAILKDAAQFEMELGKQKISVEKAYLDSEVSMGKMSAEQRLTAEKGFADQEYALELQSLNNYIATLTVGTLAYQQAMEKRLLLTASYEAQIAKIAQQTEKEREQYALQADQAITTSLGSLIDNLVNRTTTLKKAWMDFATQLQQSLVKIASNEVMKQFLGAGTSGGSALSSLTSKIFGSGGTAQAAAEAANTTAITALTAAVTANTTALAASGAGGISSAFSSTQGGGAGSLFGSAGGILSSLLGFEQGTNYVPSTSLAVVHKGEAIVPAKYNVGGSGMTARTYINVSGPIDTRSQDQISKAAAKGIHRASRRVS